MIRHCWPILVLLCFGVAPTPARAGYELVVNGGFDSGDFSGWIAGNGNQVALQYGVDGGFGVKYGAAGMSALLYQTIPTTPGATYLFSFWQQTRGPKPNEFQAYWNGGPIVDLIDSPQSDHFTLYSFTEVATSTSTQIRFDLRQDSGYSALDQVSVRLAGSVPEPPTIGMLATALVMVGTGVVVRRRRPNPPCPAA